MSSLVRRYAGVIVGIVALACLGFLQPAHVRATGTVTNCLDSGGGSLRAAIGGGGAVNFTPGLNCTSTGAGPITLTSGTLTLAANVTIDGTGATIVVDGNNLVRVFTVNAGVTATLSGLTIQHGNAGSSPGGGIYNQGTLTLTNSTISNNRAASPYLLQGIGGGVYNGGTLTLTNSTLSGNSALNGGGIYNDGGTLTVTYSAISNNRAANVGPSLNQAAGGGVYNGGTLTLTNSTLSGNTAYGVHGFSSGGGIASSGTLTVTNSTITGGDASTGGGMSVGGTTRVTNSTISNNRAANPYLLQGIGGGIYIYNGGTLTLTNSTITGNNATSTTSTTIDTGAGGGLYNGGTLILSNTIVATNTATTGPDISGTVTSSHNLVSTTSGSSGITNGVNGDIVSSTPGLGTLGNNGGPTETIPLLPGSPAIDAGAPVGSGPAGNTVPATDQRGIPRPQGSGVDIGAFEYQPPLLSIAVTPGTATVKVGQAQPFTATGTYANNATADLTSQVTWASDAPNVVGVDATGKGTGKVAGTAHITATQGSVSGQATVTVSAGTPLGIAPAPAPANRPGGASAPSATPAPGGSPRDGTTNGTAPAPAPTGR